MVKSNDYVCSIKRQKIALYSAVTTANIVLYRNYYNYFCNLLRTGTATPEEQLRRHEILRAPSGLRARPQDDIVFLEGDCVPFTPALQV